MKLKKNTLRALLVTVGIILGVIVIVNLFSPCVFSSIEGFKEGNSSTTTTTTRQCKQATEKCEKKIRDHIIAKIDQSVKEKLRDKHFKNGEITNDFVNYAKTNSIDLSKNIECKNFANCTFTEKSSSSPSPSPSPAPATAPATASSTSTTPSTEPTNQDIMDEIKDITDEIKKITK